MYKFQETRVPQNEKYVTWILIALLFILKLKMFMKILQIMLKKGMTHKNYEDNLTFPTKKNKKVIKKD